MKYTVSNRYNVSGESTHKTPEAALKSAAKREGLGWYVSDDEGNIWDWDINGSPEIIMHHNDD